MLPPPLFEFVKAFNSYAYAFLLNILFTLFGVHGYHRYTCRHILKQFIRHCRVPLTRLEYIPYQPPIMPRYIPHEFFEMQRFMNNSYVLKYIHELLVIPAAIQMKIYTVF